MSELCRTYDVGCHLSRSGERNSDMSVLYGAGESQTHFVKGES